MHFVKTILLATALTVSTSLTARAELKVVASIKPVHSLVAAVMNGVGIPSLIVEGAGSPHTYSMKPSKARTLEKADVVFWIGHELETFLEKPIDSIASKAKIVSLMDAHDLVKLKFREGGAFEAHDHHEHSDDEVHADEKDKHGYTEEEEHDDNGQGETNPHIWLDPLNAKTLVFEIEETLSTADSANAKKYETNANALEVRLDALVTGVSKQLAPVKGKGFVVFHDAYPYFENRFGLKASGAISVSPDIMPGVKRIAEIQEHINELGVACVFTEPQFAPTLVATVLEGSTANSGVLDPLGSALTDGPDLYFDLVRTMAGSFKSCLNKAS
jgi:zinc transport system substrate-binding protein